MRKNNINVFFAIFSVFFELLCSELISKKTFLPFLCSFFMVSYAVNSEGIECPRSQSLVSNISFPASRFQRLVFCVLCPSSSAFYFYSPPLIVGPFLLLPSILNIFPSSHHCILYIHSCLPDRGRGGRCTWRWHGGCEVCQ